MISYPTIGWGWLSIARLHLGQRDRPRGRGSPACVPFPDPEMVVPQALQDAEDATTSLFGADEWPEGGLLIGRATLSSVAGSMGSGTIAAPALQAVFTAR
jgi:hypothetical protein